MKELIVALVALLAVNIGRAEEPKGHELAVRNLERALMMNDSIFDAMYDQRNHRLYFYYNMETKKRTDIVSVWEFTAALETVNSVLEGLEAVKESEPALYEEHYAKNVKRLENLYNDIGYYRGTFSLVSYTGRNSWSPYGVHRANSVGAAAVAGIENVYDDQMWIIRELIRAYRLTKKSTYLTRAEELTRYVLDGWDCTLDEEGNEHGGITWGPGYTSKHACSNSPIISPLVWLHEIYANGEAVDRNGQDYYELGTDGKRVAVHKTKADFYLDFAKKIYEWQRRILRSAVHGTYYDGIWSVTGDITSHTIDGVEYRDHVASNANPQGTYHTYNTGTMLSGAADLYRATGDEYYLTELQTTALKSYNFFTGYKRVGSIRYRPMIVAEDRSTNPSKNGNPWFNQVLFRGFVAAAPYYSAVDNYLKTFQEVLDYGFDNHRWLGFLPVDLISGWQEKDTERCNVQYTFSRVSEYALLVKYFNDATGIDNPQTEKKSTDAAVYTLDGRKVKNPAAKDTSLQGLAKGLYIVDGQKVAVN